MIALADGEHDGVLLFAELFCVVLTLFGLLADAIQFTGETAAALAGGALRLAGGAVRLFGQAVGGLGGVIEGSGDGGIKNGRDQQGDGLNGGQGGSR
jgi:hypothetical protein